MILLLDNYDSFTYNLYQYAGTINPDILVVRNDNITIEEIKVLRPDKIIISPGPGFPQDAGISIAVVRELGAEIPILGICLGHQAVGEAYGGKTVHAPTPVHGKTSIVDLDGSCPLFQGLPLTIEAGRYHSLLLQRETLPRELTVTAQADSLVMGVAHKRRPSFGVQFHPESILTPQGKRIIQNFLWYC